LISKGRQNVATATEQHKTAISHLFIAYLSRLLALDQEGKAEQQNNGRKNARQIIQDAMPTQLVISYFFLI